eukprot:164293_1
MEQISNVYAVFQNNEKCKNKFQKIDVFRKYFTNLTIKYQILTPTNYLLQLLDECSPFIRYVYRFNTNDYELYSNIIEHITECNIDALQLKQKLIQNDDNNESENNENDENNDNKSENEANEKPSEPLTLKELLMTTKVSDEQMSTLDIITGFEIIENNHKLIVIEGRKDGNSMINLLNKIPIEQNENRYFLINNNIYFQHRLYSKFHCKMYKLKLNK